MISDATAKRMDQRRADITTTFSKGIRNVGEFSAYVRSMEVVQEGSQVWSAEQDGSITIRKGASGAVEYSIPKKKDVFVSCLLAQNFYVWAGLTDGYLRVYNIENNELVLEIKQHSAAVSCLVGHVGRVYSGSVDWQIFAWDGKAPEQAPESVKFLAQFSGHQNSVRCMAIDERCLYSGSDDGSVRCWDIDTSNEKTGSFPITGHKAPVTALLLYGVYLVSASSDGNVMVWNCQNAMHIRTLIREQPRGGSGMTLLRDPTGERIWTGGHDGVLTVWDAQTFRPLTRLLDHSGTMVTNMKAICRVNAMKIWTVGANGAVKVWYSETETADADYSAMGKLEEELQGNIEAMQGTIIQNYQELERRKAQLKNLETTDRRRKVQLANAMGRVKQAQILRKHFRILTQWFSNKRIQHARPQIAKLLEGNVDRKQLSVYYHKWFNWWSQRRVVQRQLEMTRSMSRVSDGSLTTIYLKKMAEYAKIAQRKRQRAIMADTLHQTCSRALLWRYWMKLVEARALIRAQRKTQTVAEVMARVADQATMGVHLQKLVSFSRLERERERRFLLAQNLQRASESASMRSFFGKWARWHSHRKSLMLKERVVTVMGETCLRGILTRYYYALRANVFLKRSRAGERTNRLERDRLGAVEAMQQQYGRMSTQQLAERIADSDQELLLAREQLSALRESNEELKAANVLLSRELSYHGQAALPTGVQSVQKEISLAARRNKLR